jgi:hypothetical protein
LPFFSTKTSFSPILNYVKPPWINKMFNITP